MFGDNLVESVKSISKVSKLSDKMGPARKPVVANSSSRFHPYTRGRGFSQCRGRGGQFWGRGRGIGLAGPSNSSNSSESQTNQLSTSSIKVRELPMLFIAGNLKNHLGQWDNLTSDKVVLGFVKGVSLDFLVPGTVCHAETV